jgi:Reverse transcriptase (RNA-dependent DNA polymerase)
MRYKARTLAQSCTRILGISYEETYSSIVNAITLRFIISHTITENLQMHLMDIVTTYLYRSPDNDIDMRVTK